MKKILSISDRLPNSTGAGGILFTEIIREYGPENFYFVSVSQKIDFDLIPAEFKNRPMKQFALNIPDRNIIFKIFKKLPLVETLYVLTKYIFLKKKIIKLIEEHKFDFIFSTLRGSVLLILNDVLLKTKLPLYSMVEDTVEREIDDPKLIYKIKRKRYYSLLPQVKKLAVAGETMQEYFKTNFNINSTILRHSYSSFSAVNDKQFNGTLNVFFAGNIYAKKEMKSFLKALTHFSSDLKLNFYVASRQKLKVKSDNVSVINLGWVGEKELIHYMEKCHIAYLPYKSETKYMHSMKYAFPAKAGLYISNNLPIFFHGPLYSSFNYFLTKYQVGLSCDSLDSKIIVKRLHRFISDSSFYSLCQVECKKAFEMEYDKEIFKKRVFEFCN